MISSLEIMAKFPIMILTLRATSDPKLTPSKLGSPKQKEEEEEHVGSDEDTLRINVNGDLSKKMSYY